MMGFKQAAAALVLFSVAAQADITFFHERNAFADFHNFMGTKGDFTKTFTGKTSQGEACAFTVSSDGKTLTFRPANLGATMTFVVTEAYNPDLNGGFEGNKLWSSYFIDDKGHGPTIHGQFGINYSLELEKNTKGDFTRFKYAKIRHRDLGFTKLGLMDCVLK